MGWAVFRMEETVTKNRTLVGKYLAESLPEPLVEKLVCSRGCKALNKGCEVLSDPDTQKYKSRIISYIKRSFQDGLCTVL